MSHFGANIKKIRSIKKLSQSAFADLFSLTRSSVAAYEEGRAEPKYDKPKKPYRKLGKALPVKKMLLSFDLVG